MPVGTEVDLGPGDIVLNGDPAPPSPKKGAQPPIFYPRLLWPNGCMDQDATYVTELRLGPGHTVVDGDPTAIPKKGGTAPQFSAHVCCGQTA